MNYQHTLESIGLKADEAKVYLACLRLGYPRASDLARELDIPRTSIYLHAEGLVRKGFLKKSRRGKIEHFSATEPETILRREKEKTDAFALAAPHLARLADLSGTPTRVEYWDTTDGLRALYASLLTIPSTETPILIESGEATRWNIEKLGWNFWLRWEKKMIQKGIRTEGIITEDVLPLLESAPDHVRRVLSDRDAVVRVLPAGAFPLAMNIYLSPPVSSYFIIPQHNSVIRIEDTIVTQALISLYHMFLPASRLFDTTLLTRSTKDS